MANIGINLKKRVAGFLINHVPNIYEQLHYFSNYHTFYSRKHPHTFSEKLLWLKHNTYSDNELILKLLDKYHVRNYVAERGLSDILPFLYFDTTDIDDITYDTLPDSFALKRSSGCGTNLICSNKAMLSQSRLCEVLDEWRDSLGLYDLGVKRLAGKATIPDVHYICEECLCGDDGSLPPDYKFYCFNGNPIAILFISNRENKNSGGKAMGCFLDTDWGFLSDLNSSYESMDNLPPKPEGLSRMLDVAHILSEPFPFVRVDLYDIDGRVVFGELTFIPNGCIGTSETPIDGHSMGDLLKLPFESYR